MPLSDLHVALAAATAGAEVVGSALGSRTRSRLKGSVNPVTEVDEAAEQAILSILRRERPDDGRLAEETGGSGWERGRAWIVDPLDGTINFLHGIPHVAVSVALWEEGVPKVGVIVDVGRDQVFAAEEGRGATCNGEPLEVSRVDEPASALIATGFPYDRQERADAYTAVVAAVLRRFQGVRRFGSAALDLAWVAAGRYGGYWEYSIGPWDAAAGILLAREAGAVVSNVDGDPYRLDDEAIVAASPALHPHLLSAVRSRHPLP